MSHSSAIGGATLVVGPLVWLAGLTTRHLAVTAATFTPAQAARLAGEEFDGPKELAAYAQHPDLVTAGYALFAAGAVVLCLALVTLARVAAARSPRLALAGGALVVVSLFARLYWAGVDHTAFQLVDRVGVDQATRIVMDIYPQISYGPWRLPVTAAFGWYLGVPLLGAAAFRAGTFGLIRLVLFLASATLWSGVLKASTWDGVASSALLCLALVPLGVGLLRGRTAPAVAF
ncbi:hypothetical protein [Microbispora siamensis]|uniref:PAP2 superfamily protein n=1 Tax=Microbispora siamensis TaxID=564413 RepID=A0ABQ4GJ85_9ACTN|nr:hypothetical protein [Microbispora siamensis]GIH61468.1 hypothetical protein Msi02_22850 [Microbispora siamensis]